MEYILMALFGGGILDWQDISKTEYEWEDIFNWVKNSYSDFESVDMNTLYETILRMALNELEEYVGDYIRTTETKEEKILAERLKEIDFEEDFEIFTNYLDTHINFIGDEELGKLLNQLFSNEIEEINDKIGFTYIGNL